MGKKKGSQKKPSLEKILLLTAIANLITAISNLVKSLTG